MKDKPIPSTIKFSPELQAKIAEEMGTSVAMLHRHYHNPKAEAEGVEWFAVRPASDPICSDGIEVNVAESEILLPRNARKTRETA